MKKFIFGITGGLGVGKSYTCNKLQEIFKEREAKLAIIEIDLIRRYILKNSTEQRHIEIRKQLIKKLQMEIYEENYSINGRILGEIIFNDQKCMNEYRKIVNGGIKRMVRSEINNREEKYIAIEWSMLVEDEYLHLVKNNVLIVSCGKGKVLKRLKGTDLPKNQLMARITFQPSLAETIQKLKKEKAKYIIFDTSTDPTKKKYRELAKNIINQTYVTE
jgi:dephospho-CoA kinase